MSQTDFSPPPGFRRNFAALLVDYIGFGVAFSFISLNAVLPAFVRSLTDSEPLVGLIGTVFNAGWLLPQLGVATLIVGRPRKKPYMMAASYTARPLFLLLGLVTWAGLPEHSTAMLTVFFTCIGLFTVLDSVASVAWFDILARVVPVSRRGRLVGTAQIVGGGLGMAVGGLVSVILASPSLPFPKNYALLFALSFAAHIPGIIALGFLKEPEADDQDVNEEERHRQGLLDQLMSVWKGDPGFRRLMVVRWLTGLMGLASPFYILHATEAVGLSETVTGWFVSAQMAGGIVASLGLGWLSERHGPRPAVRLGSAAALGSPLVALLLHLTNSSALARIYPLAYFLYGVTVNSAMLGPLNYLLEMAPAEQRALYIGLANTLMGALVPISLLGGVLLRATSYPVLFAITAAGITGGLVASLGLEKAQGDGS
ncbi:MAG: MFS transporter [Anaerolineae bacterium]|jgi:MFS family permease